MLPEERRSRGRQRVAEREQTDGGQVVVGSQLAADRWRDVGLEDRVPQTSEDLDAETRKRASREHAHQPRPDRHSQEQPRAHREASHRPDERSSEP